MTKEHYYVDDGGTGRQWNGEEKRKVDGRGNGDLISASWGQESIFQGGLAGSGL